MGRIKYKQGIIIRKAPILLFFCFVISTCRALDCVYPDIDMCRDSDGNGGVCNCPCIPKCCPDKQYLIPQSNPEERGYACSSEDKGLPLVPPPIKLEGKLKESREGKNLKFFESSFPTCTGIEEKPETNSSRWMYELHDNFTINADFESEYILHSNGPNNGEIAAILGGRSKNKSNSSSIMGFPNYDSLTSFCVDYLYKNESFSTIALTCPRLNSKSLNETNTTLVHPIKKCCPPGMIFQHSHLNHCTKVVNKTALWRLPINGYLQHEDDMYASGNLIYREDHNFKGLNKLCGKSSEVQSESDIFLIGEDGRLHFTDTYEDKVNLAAPFCVDQIFIHGINPEDYEYSEDYEYEYDDPEVPTFIESCHHKHPKPHQMIIFYCQEPVIQIRKCCSKGENLNVRAQTCTSDMSSQIMSPPTVYGMNNRDTVSKDRILNINEMNLRNLRAEELAVSTDPFYFREDRTLLYNGVRYKENEFCLDYVIDYCGDIPSMSLKAIIADKSLIHNKVGTIFGSNRLDSVWSRNFKRVGFTISAVSLIVVIFIFVIVKELRQFLTLIKFPIFIIHYIFSEAVAILSTFQEPGVNIPFYRLYHEFKDNARHTKSIHGPDLSSGQTPKILALHIISKKREILNSHFQFSLEVVLEHSQNDLWPSTEDLHGKMVLCIVSSLLIVYSGLLSTTFQDNNLKFISKKNGWCIAQGCITYFFTMSTFGWMSAMSYNIMTKFRVRTILPRGEEGIRFFAYAAYSFGVSLILLGLVLIFQSKSGSSWYRPGIGEESCWFTSCSSGLTIFLYIPIAIFLIFNMIMFTFSAVKLQQLSKKIQGTAKQPVEEPEESSSTGGRISNMRESVRAALNRQFSRTTSSKQRKTYMANREVFLTYLKLFCAMGQNWTLEVLAWFFTSSEDSLGWIQYLLNFLNMLQGLVMFFVFVFKPSTFKQLRKYFAFCCSKKKSKGGNLDKHLSNNAGVSDSWGGYDNPEKRLTYSSVILKSTDALELDTSVCDMSEVVGLNGKKGEDNALLNELETVKEVDEVNS